MHKDVIHPLQQVTANEMKKQAELASEGDFHIMKYDQIEQGYYDTHKVQAEARAKRLAKREKRRKKRAKAGLVKFKSTLNVPKPTVYEVRPYKKGVEESVAPSLFPVVLLFILLSFTLFGVPFDISACTYNNTHGPRRTVGQWER